MRQNRDVARANSSVYLVLVLSFLINFTFHLSVWSLILLDLGFSIAMLSAYMSVHYLTQLICELPSGIMSDRLGARKTLVLGEIVQLIGFGLFLLFPNGVTLIVLAFCGGFECAMLSDTDTTLVYKILKATRQMDYYPRFFAWHNALGFIGYGLASLIGAFLASHWGLMSTLWASFPVYLLFLILSFYLREPKILKNITAKKEQKCLSLSECRRLVWRRRDLRSSVVYAAIIYTINMTVWAYYQNYAEQLGLPLNYYGFLALAFSLCEAGPQFLSHHFVHHRQIQRVYMLLTILAGICLLIASLKIDAWGIGFLLLAIALTGLSFPISDTVIRRGNLVSAWTTIISIKTFISILAFVVTNTIFGVVADNFGLQAGFLVVVGIATVALVLFSHLGRKLQSEEC